MALQTWTSIWKFRILKLLNVKSPQLFFLIKLQKLLKQNWLQFVFVVKAAAMKPKIKILYKNSKHLT